MKWLGYGMAYESFTSPATQNTYKVLISLMEWYHASQPLFTDKPYTVLIQGLNTPNLTNFLILYNDWQVIYYKQNDLI